jgi:capsular exopolysaccharide synthesis family protein
LVRYQRENNIVGLDEKQNIVTAKLEQLNRDFTTAQTERIQKEATYNLVKTGDASLVVRAEPNSLLQQLKQQQAGLQVQLAQLTTQFGPSYPAVRQLQNQLHQLDSSIETEINAMQQRVNNEYRQATARESMLRAALEQQKKDANELSEKGIQYSLLKRDADSNRQLYEGIQQRMKEASVAAGLRSNNITVVDYAPVAASPVVPNVPLNILLGALFGAIGGVVLAFLIENLDNTVRTPEHVELASQLPTLGIVPRIDSALAGSSRRNSGKLFDIRNTLRHERPGAAVALAAIKQPKSGVAEAYRAVRTSVLLGRAGAAPKTILITSALPKEGKSTSSANIAAVLAQRGGRVIIIDADLRRPSLHHIFSVTNHVGLSNVLAGGTGFADAITHSDSVPNLDIMTAGPLSPQPSELLSSSAMVELLKKCAAEYDHVVVDSPPLLSVTDAGILSAWADAVVLVVRSGKTTKHQLKQSSVLMRQLGAPVMGVLVNAVDMEGSDRYYYGYSRYYYYRPYTSE